MGCILRYTCFAAESQLGVKRAPATSSGMRVGVPVLGERASTRKAEAERDRDRDGVRHPIRCMSIHCSQMEVGRADWIERWSGSGRGKRWDEGEARELF